MPPLQRFLEERGSRQADPARGIVSRIGECEACPATPLSDDACVRLPKIREPEEQRRQDAASCKRQSRTRAALETPTCQTRPRDHHQARIANAHKDGKAEGARKCRQRSEATLKASPDCALDPPMATSEPAEMRTCSTPKPATWCGTQRRDPSQAVANRQAALDHHSESAGRRQVEVEADSRTCAQMEIPPSDGRQGDGDEETAAAHRAPTRKQDASR